MGKLASLGAAACWALSSLIFQRVGATVSALAMNLFKCVLAGVLLALTLLVAEGALWLSEVPMGDLTALGASGLLGLTVGDTLFFLALTRIGPRLALLMSALIPPTTALMAVAVLGENISALGWLGVALTLGGVTWVVAERTEPSESFADRDRRGFWIGVALAGGWALAQAGGNVLAKLGAAEASSLGIAVVRLAVGSAGLIAVVAARGRLWGGFRPLGHPRSAGLLVVATLIATYLGIWLMMFGLTHALVGVASTLSATAPLFVLPLAAVFLGERISLRAVLGAGVAVGGVAILCLP